MKFRVELPIIQKEESFSEESKLPSQGVVPLHPTSFANLSEKDLLDELIEGAKRQGFCHSAVVGDGRKVYHTRIDPTSWGFVVGYNRSPSALGKLEEKAAIVIVKWASGSFENCSEQDLVLVHPALNNMRIHAIFAPRVRTGEL